LNSYTLHITLYDLFFFGMILIGVNFALLLAFTKSINRSANRLLALALLTMILWMMRILAMDVRLQTYMPGWDRMPMQFLLALGPLTYFYVLKITRPEYKLSWTDLLHFSPLLVEQGAFVLEIRESVRTGLATYATTAFQLLSPVLQLLIFISIITYLYRSHQLTQNFYRRLQPVLMDRSVLEFRWLRRLLAATALLWFLWIAYAAVDYFGFRNQLGMHVYYPFYIFFAVIIIWTAMAAFLRPQAAVRAKSVPILKSSPPAELRQKGAWLKKVIKEKRYYEDPELSLVSLAQKLGLTTHELSRIINQGLKKSFNDFINEYRVAEVRRKMQDPGYGHLNLLGIAYESGFNSKTTFNRAFKQATGKNPVDYKKEAPSYNSGLPARFANLISSPETTPLWFQEKLNRNVMLKNYLKIGWRSLMRNKSYAAINVTGLAIGIAACLLIFLVIHFETSFDNFHSNRDHIYRIVAASKTPQGMQYGVGIPLPTAQGLRLDYPQIIVGSIFKNSGQISVLNEKAQAIEKFKEDKTYFADPEFFEVFDFIWLAGDKKTALSGPNTVVLTRGVAEKYFGNWRNALGKILKFENKINLKVTGVLKNMPPNTDFDLNVIVSQVTLANTDLKDGLQDWGSTYGDYSVFVVLPQNMPANLFDKDLAVFTKKHKPAKYANDGFISQSLIKMHNDDQLPTISGNTFSKDLINVLTLIGSFLLVIACINFINLATAQAVNRSKEVGIRKVLGSSRKQLVFQFISETFIITVFAVVLAIGISEAALPLLNQLLDAKLTTAFLIDPIVAVFLISVLIGVTLLAGFYPAIVLSGFNPITALKNKMAATRSSGISLRHALVVLQFCIAQVLIFSTLVIINQMDLFRNKSLGFNKDAVITAPIPNDSVSRLKLKSLRNQLMQRPGIKNVSYSFASPADNNNWSSDFYFNNSTKKTDFSANLKFADADYFNLYNLKFVAGRPYTNNDAGNGYVVNETLLKKLGITNPENAIGKNISLDENKSGTNRIVGVIKDFNVRSLLHEIPPVLMGNLKDNFQTINIKLQGANIKSTLYTVEKLWNATFPNYVYNYQFLDEKIASFYKQQAQLAALYKIFAGIAIFISCLGLYGLVSFMAVQRTCEVGIRKTLGASTTQIVYLFSKEFTLLIIVAYGLSAPVGYYFMQKWLQNFTYRISIGPLIFILAIGSSAAIAWATVGYKAIQAALANPTKSLRSE
jgi:putative ABC transport system permease protein